MPPSALTAGTNMRYSAASAYPAQGTQVGRGYTATPMTRPDISNKSKLNQLHRAPSRADRRRRQALAD